MKNVMIILLSIYASSALAKPISLICTEDSEINGETEKAINHLYINIEEDEMLFRGSDETGSEEMDWIVMEDIQVDRLSVSGKWLIGGKSIYTTYTVDRENLELNRTVTTFGKEEKLTKSKCEIADFKIETAF